MIHGGRDASVRAPATLDAIEALVAAERLDADTARELADAYRLLRTIEHRVQMVEDAQTHLLPAQPQALDNVARLHGLASGAELIDLLRPRVERVGEIFDSVSPDERRQLSTIRDILRAELAELGFADAEGRQGTSAIGGPERRGRCARRLHSRRLRRCSQAFCRRSPPAPIRTARSIG